MASPDHAATVREASAELADAADGILGVRADDLRAEIVTTVDALVAAVAQAEHERDEALSHCRGPMPSPERIAEMHSRLPADWFTNGYARLANHGVGHFAYFQGPEACYVCTLLGLAERAERQRDQATEALREITETRAGAVTADLMLEIARDVLASIEKDTA